MTTIAPDQFATIGGEPLTASDIINALITAQDQGTKQILTYFGQSDLAGSASPAFMSISLGAGAIFSALEGLQQGGSIGNVIPTSIIDMGLSYLTAESAVEVAGALGFIGGGPLGGGLAVGVAVIGGFVGHLAAGVVNNALSGVESGTDGAAAKQALQSGQSYTLPTNDPSIPTVLLNPS